MSSKFLGPAIVTLILITSFYFIISRGGEDEIDASNTKNSTEQTNSKAEPVKPVTATSKTFPEPNTPPYYYAKIGDRIEVENNAEWYLQFVKVISDERCPQGVQCVRSGPITIQVQIANKNADTLTADLIELQSPGFSPVLVQRKSPDGNEINWEVTLRDLVPHPSAEEPEPKPEDYIGLFHINILK